MRAGKHAESGHAFLELALILPFLVTLALGAADFGRVIALKLAVQETADAAAKLTAKGAQRNGSCPSRADLTAVSAAPSQVRGIRVTAELACTNATTLVPASRCGCGGAGTFVQVTAAAPFHTLGGYRWLAAETVIEATAAARVQ